MLQSLRIFEANPVRGISRFRSLPFGRSAHTASAGLPVVVGVALSIFMAQSGLSQTHEEPAPSDPVQYTALLLEPPTQNVRAFSRVTLGGGRELEYLGTFCATAKYKKSSSFTRA